MTITARSRVMSAHKDTNGNLAFKRWAICVASIYGFVTFLVVGVVVLLALSTEPVAQISSGYSPQFSREIPVTPRRDGQSVEKRNGASPKAYSSRALRLVRHQLELVGHSAELGKRTGLRLLHRPAAMHLHRGFGDADIVGNLFAQAAARHLNYDLALPGAERGEALPEVRQSLFIFPPRTIARKAELNGVEEVLVTERLGQELMAQPFIA
jgi:hypothetical protein